MSKYTDYQRAQMSLNSASVAIGNLGLVSPDLWIFQKKLGIQIFI